MSQQLPTRTVSVWINRRPELVYAYLAEPQNFAHWASGLGEGLQPDGDAWIAQMEICPVRIRFSPRNEFGIVDHWVTPEGAGEMYNPMRVFPNGTGTEVAFTLFRQPEMTDEVFERDAAWVQKDLETLKRILEETPFS